MRCDRLSVWGVAGYGEGRLTLTPAGQAPIGTDLDLMMAAAGLRGVLVHAPQTAGLELAVNTDAMGVRTSTAIDTAPHAAEAAVAAAHSADLVLIPCRARDSPGTSG